MFGRIWHSFISVSTGKAYDVVTGFELRRNDSYNLILAQSFQESQSA